MDQDKFALVQKILKDIDIVMTKNTELCVFDIIPVEGNNWNKSPVRTLENCLGLESWCVKHVYLYCYCELFDKYFAKPKKKAVKVNSMNFDNITKLLNTSLLINPDCLTMWNKRREMVEKSFLNEMEELRFTKLVLSRKAKSSETFSYRKWLLGRLLSEITPAMQPNLQNLISEELEISKMAADKNANNYHAWSHRIWFIKTLARHAAVIDLNLIYLCEYSFSETWMSRNVSDFSGYFYRQFCVTNVLDLSSDTFSRALEEVKNVNLHHRFYKLILDNIPVDSELTDLDFNELGDKELVTLVLKSPFNNNRSDVFYTDIYKKIKILIYELKLNEEFLNFYKQHETLWYHRRFTLQNLFTLIYQYYGISKQDKKAQFRDANTLEKQAKISKYDVDFIYNSILYKVATINERKIINTRNMDGDMFAKKHEKYINFNLDSTF